MTTPPLPVISSPRRSRLWLWLTLGGLAAIIAIGTPVYLFYRLANRFGKEYAPVAATLPSELAAAKKECLPTTIEELRPKPPIKDTDNAAPLYRKLTVLNKQKKSKREDADKAAVTSYLTSGVRTAKQDQEIRTFLAAHAAELSLAEQVARKPACDFARDWNKGMEINFPELSVMRDVVRLLMLRAALRSDENKPIVALQDVTLAAKMANHSASDPTLISALVKAAIQAIANRCFVEILQRHGNNPAIFPAAREAVAALASPIDLRHAFSGEMVLMGATFTEIRNAPDFGEKMRRQGIRIPTSNPQVQPQMADAWHSRSVAYWRQMQRSLANSKGDLLYLEKEIQSIQKEEDTNRLAPGYEMNAILTSVYLRMPSKIMQAEASNHLRQNMLALLEHKQKTGKFPDSLGDLPETTAKTDPFTNQPLLYKKTEKGFVLYSVSNNRKDDSGSAKKVKIGDSNWPEDIVVSYP